MSEGSKKSQSQTMGREDPQEILNFDEDMND